jgi:hypothetical protein
MNAPRWADIVATFYARAIMGVDRRHTPGESVEILRVVMAHALFVMTIIGLTLFWLRCFVKLFLRERIEAAEWHAVDLDDYITDDDLREEKKKLELSHQCQTCDTDTDDEWVSIPSSLPSNNDGATKNKTVGPFTCSLRSLLSDAVKSEESEWESIHVLLGHKTISIKVPRDDVDLLMETLGMEDASPEAIAAAGLTVEDASAPLHRLWSTIDRATLGNRALELWVPALLAGGFIPLLVIFLGAGGNVCSI